MGSVNVATASGQGSISLGGTQPVIEFSAYLVTPGLLTNFFGTSPVRRVFQVGWVGLTEHSTSPPADIVVWKTFVENESEDKIVSYSPGNDPDTLWWDFTPGTVVNIFVFW